MVEASGEQAVHDAQLVQRVTLNSGWLSPKMIWSASRMASAWADQPCTASQSDHRCANTVTESTIVVMATYPVSGNLGAD